MSRNHHGSFLINQRLMPGILREFLVTFDQSPVVVIDFLDELKRDFISIDYLDHPLKAMFRALSV
jgi:hypothetical protein